MMVKIIGYDGFDPHCLPRTCAYKPDLRRVDTSYNNIVVKLQCIPHIDNEDSDINLSFLPKKPVTSFWFLLNSKAFVNFPLCNNHTVSCVAKTHSGRTSLPWPLCQTPCPNNVIVINGCLMFKKLSYTIIVFSKLIP